MKHIAVLFQFLAILAISFPVQANWYSVIARKKAAGGADPNQLFFSDFEDASDRSQWATLPSGWSNNYATSPAPLFGSFSAYSSGVVGTLNTAVDLADSSSSVIYVRVPFRATATPSATGEAMSINVLDASGSVIARSVLRFATGSPGTFYRLYAHDSTTSSFVAPGTPKETLDDQTYYLHLIYTRGTSVVAELRDASNTLVTGYTATRATTDDLTFDEIGVSKINSAGTFVFDNVEIRTDTSW